MNWIFIEWLGTFLGISGSLMLASKKFNPLWSWGVWILSNIIFTIFFSIYLFKPGLLFMYTIGTITTAIGFWQWMHSDTPNKFLRNTFSIIGFSFLPIILILIFYFISYPKLSTIEWIGALFSISGAFLVASKHRLWAACWFMWLIGNFLILIVSIYYQKWGVATLQICFTISNIYGFWTWIYINDNFFIQLKKTIVNIQNRLK